MLFAQPPTPAPHPLPALCRQGKPARGRQVFRTLPIGIFAVLACLPQAEAGTAKKSPAHTHHSTTKSTLHRSAAQSGSAHHTSSGKPAAASPSSHTAMTRAEADAERSGRPAQAATAATQAERAALDKHEAGQAASVPPARAQK